MAKKPVIPYDLLPLDDPRLQKFHDGLHYLGEAQGYYRNTRWQGFIPTQSKRHVNPTQGMAVGVDYSQPEARMVIVTFTNQGNIESAAFFPLGSVRALGEAMQAIELAIMVGSQEITSTGV